MGRHEGRGIDGCHSSLPGCSAAAMGTPRWTHSLGPFPRPIPWALILKTSFSSDGAEIGLQHFLSEVYISSEAVSCLGVYLLIEITGISK